jgi:hypothetical protein
MRGSSYMVCSLVPSAWVMPAVRAAACASKRGWNQNRAHRAYAQSATHASHIARLYARAAEACARTGVVDDVCVGSADDVSGDAAVGAVPRGTAGVLLDGGGRVLQRFFVVACQRAPPVSRRVI